MKHDITKGLAWISLIILLWAVACKVKAGTPDEFLKILSDKQVVYAGVCHFDKNQVLTFKADEAKTTVRCIVGFEPGVTTKHYVVKVGDDMQASEVVLYDTTTKKQVTLWRRGIEV